jgi:glycosyltransferase 2 family protein
VKFYKRQPGNESANISNHRPRSIAWVLLLASAAAVLLTGLAGTALVLSAQNPSPASLRRPALWIGLAIACCLTLLSLGLRALRWIFLLRRSETRIPIRDAYIGYFAGLSLLLAPFLVGEIAVRAYVLRQRGGVPVASTAVVNIWERFLDVAALAAIMATLAFASGQGGATVAALFGGVGATMLPPVRRRCLQAAVLIGKRVGYFAGDQALPDFSRLTNSRAWLVGLATSVVAWLIPGVAFWILASTLGPAYGLGRAEYSYASSTLAGGLVLAPGGILVVGGRLLGELRDAGFSDAAAALSVMGIRFATTGLSTALGAVSLVIHARSRPASTTHFDEIADAYDVQIPQARREALLTRKTELMRDVIVRQGIGRRGLDVGCGQGWYVARMRELGFDVVGIDASPAQALLAARNIGSPDLVRIGSALHISAADASYDFVYTINVLHHLPSVADQRAAFAELIRVLRPGGLIFVHEINTRNMVFRFYMGYVFPSLNCIDEGVERWILPHRLGRYTHIPVIDLRYFTFLPEFVPAPLVRLLAPLERLLEASRLGPYSAHYMAVLQKPV